VFSYYQDYLNIVPQAKSVLVDLAVSGPYTIAIVFRHLLIQKAVKNTFLVKAKLINKT